MTRAAYPATAHLRADDSRTPARRGRELVVALVAIVIGCPTFAVAQDGSGRGQGTPARAVDLDRLGAGRTIDVDRIPSWSGADIRAFLAGKTRRSTVPIHGTQVSYATADGRSFLWYPGNATVLRGRWRSEEHPIEVRRGGQVVATKNQARVCYDHGSNSFNPATGSGGGWECTNFLNLRLMGGETRRGDVFGLARRTAVPFVLTREAATIDDLQARLRSGNR